MEIWVIGQIALSETVKIYKENQDKCREYFSKSFIRSLDELSEQYNESKIIKDAHQFDESAPQLEGSASDTTLLKNAVYMSEVSDNMHWALWNMKQELGVGFLIDEKKMPVLQETVEVLQLFKVDYFECESKGCYLIVGDFDAFALGAYGTCIGHTKPGHAGDIMIDDRIRHISRPAKVRSK